MTDYFVDDAAADNTGSGAWDDPLKYLWLSSTEVGIMLNSTLGGGAASVDAGDTVYVLTGHDEQNTAGLTLTNNGTATNPIRIISVASFNSGSPDTLASARSCTIDHDSEAAGKDITLSADLYMYGFILHAGDNLKMTAEGRFTLEGGTLKQTRVTGGSGFETFGSVSSTIELELIDTWIDFNTTNGRFKIWQNAHLIIRGGKVVQSYTGGALIDSLDRSGRVLVEGSDWSTVDYLANFAGANCTDSLVKINNCKLKNTVTYLTGSINGPGNELLVINSYDAVNTRNFEHVQFAGIVREETTTVRTGGAQTPGAETHAIKMVGSGDNPHINDPLVSMPISFWADFSSSKTVDIYIANTTRDLNDLEIGFELQYPTYNTGGSTRVTTKGANWLVAPTNHADDTGSTWGGSPTYMQKMSITAGGATDGREGPCAIRIFSAVALDVFVDCKPVVT